MNEYETAKNNPFTLSFGKQPFVMPENSFVSSQSSSGERAKTSRIPASPITFIIGDVA